MSARILAIDRRDFQRRVLDALLAQRGPLVRLGATALLGTAIGMAIPYATRLAIDTALPDTSPRLLLAVTLGVVVLVLHQAWNQWIQARARIAASGIAEADVLSQVFRALIHSDYAALERRDAGWMTTTLTGAATALKRYLDAFSVLVAAVPLALGHFFSLANESLPLATGVVVLSGVTTLLAIGLARWEGRNTRSLLEQTAEQYRFLHTLVSRLSSLRGLFATEALGAQYSEKVEAMQRVSLGIARAETLRALVTMIGAQLLSTGILLWAVRDCFGGTLSVGGMMYSLSMASGLATSVNGLIGVISGLRSLRPYWDRVDQVFAAAREAIPLPERPIWTSDEIVLDGVSHRYGEDGRWVLEEQSIVIRKGSTHWLESPSGSGKTTTLRLIAGLLAPVRGKVSVFGLDARLAREAVLYVPQHCALFEASIRENLELLSSAGAPEIARAAELTGLGRLLRKFPMGLETHVSAQGQNLSSGQRQLIVLTAAFASPRAVLLLDEATSQIDVETRQGIAWEALRRGRTLVRVEHG